MRAAAIAWASDIPGLQVYLFRRISEDLVKTHIEGPKGLRAMLAGAVLAGKVTIVEDEVRFANGSKIYLCHCKDEKDRFKYLGAEMHVLLVDELTTFTEVIYRFLRSRVRAVGLQLADRWKGMFPRILCASNPGNIGHVWVKTAFIDGARPMELRRMPDNEGGMVRQFIPAKLDDNPSMATDDPNYRQRLRGLGSTALVQAMEDGNWNVIEGAFFDCWSGRNIVRPFPIPKHWLRFGSFDWGSAEPFSFGWWAVASERFVTPDGVVIPHGALVRYREWYGMKPGQPNVGLKMKNNAIGRGILEREAADEILAFRRADPSIFSQHGGPSIAEQMGVDDSGQLIVVNGKRLSLTRADNTRVAEKGSAAGWAQLYARIVGGEHPMLFVFSTCVDLIRTLPVLQHDPGRPEDIIDGMEDHAPDDARYAANSRPWIAAAPPPERVTITTRMPTFNELMKPKVRDDD